MNRDSSQDKCRGQHLELLQENDRCCKILHVLKVRRFCSESLKTKCLVRTVRSELGCISNLLMLASTAKNKLAKHAQIQRIDTVVPVVNDATKLMLRKE